MKRERDTSPVPKKDKEYKIPTRVDVTYRVLVLSHCHQGKQGLREGGRKEQSFPTEIKKPKQVRFLDEVAPRTKSLYLDILSWTPLALNDDKFRGSKSRILSVHTVFYRLTATKKRPSVWLIR